MYSVVGCSECDALWIVEGRPGTTECRRCGTRHDFDGLRRLAETEDREAAVAARAELLAERSGHGDATAEANAADPGQAVDDEEYLRRQGVDPDEVAAVDERDPRSTGRRETVLEALRELDAPTADEVVAYATARDVSAEYAREALSKLREAGEVSRNDGRYRLL